MPQNFRELKDTNTNTAYISNHALGAIGSDTNAYHTVPAPDATNTNAGADADPDADPSNKTPAEEKNSLYDLVTAGLTQEEVTQLNIIRQTIVNQDYIVKCLFDANAAIDIKLNKHVKISVRMLSTKEREALEGYMYAKDEYGFYAASDEAEIKSLMTEASLDYANAKDLFLRMFPRGMAQNRYVNSAVVLSLLKLNGKSLGSSLSERFASVANLPSVLTQQVQAMLQLFERAVKLELADEASIKN